ncbi:hypothetical protein MATL_G00199900 [Megalops atlanticus]|uniref:FH2 domain-containing protein n=1 Tax=Megalops atlanticus TaxID=7932 RepID=A0A9D3PMF7_MEGAT|nr:hypothetical protein MATL_G00199900 [Megalops atlanticus]
MKPPGCDRPLPPGLDQSQTPLRPAPLLRLNALDFSDLWDEEDLGLDSAEENRGLKEADTNQAKGGLRSRPLPLPHPLPVLCPARPRPPRGSHAQAPLEGAAESASPAHRLPPGTQTIWAGLEPVALDTQRLEYLFENKGSCTISLGGAGKSAPPHLLPPAILSMDCSVLDREDLQEKEQKPPQTETRSHSARHTRPGLTAGVWDGRALVLGGLLGPLTLMILLKWLREEGPLGVARSGSTEGAAESASPAHRLPPGPKPSGRGSPVALDTQRLEYLFENKGSCTISLGGAGKKQQSISVLGVKRSNIVTIALRSLPPPHLLPPAILSMDCSVLDREDLQRLQALIPSEEELCVIREAQARSPHSPLAAAELCLLTMGSVPHLRQRLQLWAFALDYDTLEREIAEPLYHLKQAMEQLAANQTFRCILATVLAIGNFLNGCKARGFELSYLGKLSQVRDTHSRQPLLHHVCVLLLQRYPQSSDLYSDITAVTRASKYDYSQVGASLSQLGSLCKASWEQLCVLEQDREGRDTEGSFQQRLPRFLRDCEERLSVLRAVHRRVVNRFHAFLLFLGYSRGAVKEISAEAFCKTVSDFALEYRTTRQAILQQREREGGRSTPQTPGHTPAEPQECVEQCMLEDILRTPESTLHFDLTLPRLRSKRSGPLPQKLKW